MKKKLATDIDTALNGPNVGTALKKLRPKYIPTHEDPKLELRRLVQEHVAHTKTAKSLFLMSNTNRKNKETGEIIPCRLDSVVIAEMRSVVASMKRKTDELKANMGKCLKKIPLYKEFLSKVFGCGEIMSAYICVFIDFEKATKPSALRRYCGTAVINGRLEVPSGAPKLIGGTGMFNREMRTRLYQMMSSMFKNAAKTPGATSKYLTVWADTVNRVQHSERVLDRGVDKLGKWTGKIVNGGGKTVSARGFARSKGMWKAVDVFLEDLYVVGRAMQGLPVWPSYYAAKLGYEHLGKISVNAPKMLTVEEAFALIGDTGKTVGLVGDMGDEDENVEEDLLEEAAE